MKVFGFLLTICCTQYFIYGKAVNQLFKGESSFNQSLIIGGSYARIEDYPFMALLRVFYKNNKKGRCCSTIFHPKAVLTVAHCFTYYEGVHLIRISIGSAYPAKRGLKYYTRNYTIHPSYDDDWYDYDIAVVKTNVKMYLDGRVSKAIVLSKEAKFVPEGTKLTILGWGYTRELAPAPSAALMETVVYALDMVKCKRIHESWRLSDRMFCAGGTTIYDACDGDSGGPAVTSAKVQVGVIAVGEHCGTTGIPSAYINVGMMYQWISKVAELK